MKVNPFPSRLKQQVCNEFLPLASNSQCWDLNTTWTDACQYILITVAGSRSWTNKEKVKDKQPTTSAVITRKK